MSSQERWVVDTPPQLGGQLYEFAPHCGEAHELGKPEVVRIDASGIKRQLLLSRNDLTRLGFDDSVALRARAELNVGEATLAGLVALHVNSQILGVDLLAK